MFFFNSLRQEDQRLRVMAIIMGSGLFVLLAGLWFVQIVSASHFESNSRRQSLKRVGIPAIRGKILDCDGRALVKNAPRYNAILYLEDLQVQFTGAYRQLTNAFRLQHPQAAESHGRLRLTKAESSELQMEARCQVVSNITYQVGASLGEMRVLNTNAFLRHYASYPYVPFDVVPNLDSNQVARFAEQLSGQPDLELETQPVRFYPWHTLAAHVLGYVQREEFDSSEISYTLPDFAGRTGIEHIFDSSLRGHPGVKLVLVNSLNYRQREDIETPNAPGDDLYLTIDLDIQRVAEDALVAAPIAPRPVRGAVVVMDVRNGDVLAMVSTPSYDPNIYVDKLTPAESAALNDPKLTPQINRAIDGAYPPGSTFKIITAIACMENGLDPNEFYDSPGFFQASPRSHRIGDTAGAGKFDFNRALFRSSNTYFIHYGMIAGLEKILAVARRFHLGEKTHFVLTPEVAGTIPLPDEVGDTILRSSTPDVCIGQEITTTPLQMACMISAIANGGRIYWPRLVSRSYSAETGEYRELFAPGRLRDTVFVNPHHLDLIRHAMLDDTEHPDDPSVNGPGTAYKAFHGGGGELTLHNFRVAGKTGTAELKSKSPLSPHRITWFDSYGPYENPRYAVVVMVEDGSFGGNTCAPVAEKIYQAIIKKEQAHNQAGGRLARN